MNYLKNRAFSEEGYPPTALTNEELDKFILLGKKFGFLPNEEGKSEDEVLYKFIQECTTMKIGYMIFQGLLEGKLMSRYDEELDEFSYADDLENGEKLEEDDWADIIE